ncbi:hypothetical protein N0V90_010742 [Kalmusia sp. IMI 367209]|nr:hypothetical protein N0V90_010742 [Kalmusia sp. IMI 367209]
MARHKPGPNLKKELEDEMIRAASHNYIIDKQSLTGLRERGKYVSNRFVAELLREENLVTHLRQEYKVWRPLWPSPLSPKLYQLLAKIRTEGPILYCILILLEREQEIQSFLYSKPAINDKKLFERDRDQPGTFCSREELRKIPQFADFVEDFYQKQWYFPPRLYSSGIPLFDLKYFRLPFLEQAIRRGSGGFGEVYGTTIASEYVRHDINEPDRDLRIAYKRVGLSGAIGRQRDMEKIFNEVNVLRDRLHPNLTEVLGSFISGLEMPNDIGTPSENLYMLYPLAETDMDKWLSERLSDLVPLNREAMEQHIYRAAIFGLISGLSFLHKEINGQVGYHRDLKPQNILLFREEKLIWKIADFGCANLKPLQDTATVSRTTTRYWAPPEFIDEGHPQDARTHGRSHDIYSLGCIFLVLTTLIVHGWNDKGRPAQAGIPDFKHRREQGTTDAIGPEVGAFHNCESVVLDWIERLRSQRPGDTKLSGVLKVIREMIQPYKKRMWAWEAEVYLYEFTEEWKNEGGDLHLSDQPSMNLEEVKQRKVLSKLWNVIQYSREMDLNMEITPAKRAESWGRTDFLDVMKKNRWFQSSPQTTDQLKQRQSVSGNPLSTLPIDVWSDNPMFGYQNKVNEMATEFGSYNVVVICGLGGLGKTRMAFAYASQFTKPDSELKKHAFWVDMTDSDTLLKSYQHMAQEMKKIAEGPEQDVRDSNEQTHFEDPTDTCSSLPYIESWLQDRSNGQWIIILDDFCESSASSHGSSHSVQHLNLQNLRHHGQILITTRCRCSSIDIIERLEHACVELSLPGLDDRLRIYDHFIDKPLFPLVDQGTKSLLEYLSLPGLIKDAVSFMNKQMKSPNDLLEAIDKNGFQTVHAFSPNLLENLLRHHLSKSLRLGEETWPYEIKQLFKLAMFGQEGASFEMLSVEVTQSAHDQLEQLDRALSTLQNSYFVQKIGATKKFRVEKTLEEAIRSWIVKYEGEVKLLHRYNETLGRMYRLYRKKRSDKELKLELKRDWQPQCGRFLKFVKDYTSRPRSDEGMEFDSQAIQTIIEFSRILYDRDFHKEAAGILDFAQARFLVDERSRQGPVDDSSARRLDIRYWLDQQRIKIYLGFPVDEQDRSPSTYWEGARAIIDRQIEQAKAWRNTETNRFKVQMRRWELSLDFIRVSHYLKDWKNAEAHLKSLEKLNIKLGSSDQIPRLNDIDELKSGIDGLATGELLSLELTKERRGSFRKLAIKKMWVEGVVHLEKGDQEDERGRGLEAIRCWTSAEEALRIAQTAWECWFPDEEMYEELSINLAETETKLGTTEGLRRAFETFEKALRSVETRHGSDCKRAWDMRCRIYAVRLRTNSELDQTAKSLQSLLAKYETRITKKGAATVRCRRQLEEARAKLRRRDEACTYTYWVVFAAIAVVICGIIWVPRLRSTHFSVISKKARY